MIEELGWLFFTTVYTAMLPIDVFYYVFFFFFFFPPLSLSLALALASSVRTVLPLWAAVTECCLPLRRNNKNWCADRARGTDTGTDDVDNPLPCPAPPPSPLARAFRVSSLAPARARLSLFPAGSSRQRARTGLAFFSEMS